MVDLWIPISYYMNNQYMSENVVILSQLCRFMNNQRILFAMAYFLSKSFNYFYNTISIKITADYRDFLWNCRYILILVVLLVNRWEIVVCYQNISVVVDLEVNYRVKIDYCRYILYFLIMVADFSIKTNHNHNILIPLDNRAKIVLLTYYCCNL